MARGRRSWGWIRQLPSGRWQANWPNPETHRLTPAPQTFPSKTAADRWLAGKRADLDRGTAVDDKAGTRPLRDWWPGYIRTIEGRTKVSTLKNYEADWRLRIEPRFGSVQVRRIRPSHIDEWMADMTASGVSASKVIESTGVLKRVLDRAVRDRVIPSNPCALRERALPRKPVTEHPVLTPAEVEKLAAAMRRDDDRFLVRFLAYTGLRIGEAFALRRRDVDLARLTLTVRESVGEVAGHLIVGPTKTYAVRTITLPELLATELGERLATLPLGGSTLVFGNGIGEHRRYRTFLRDGWYPAVKKAGIKATPHDLRATTASLLIDAGASVKDVQSTLGHSSEITTLRIYTRVRPGRSADLAQKMNALIKEGQTSP